jgi:hypothetical protein
MLCGWEAAECITSFLNSLSLAPHPDTSLGMGLCQPPSEAMIVLSSFGPPAMRPIRANPMMCFQGRIDYRPSGLDCVLTGEERSIADHGVAEKPLVGSFLSWLVLEFLIAKSKIEGFEVSPVTEKSST